MHAIFALPGFLQPRCCGGAARTALALSVTLRATCTSEEGRRRHTARTRMADAALFYYACYRLLAAVSRHLDGGSCVAQDFRYLCLLLLYAFHSFGISLYTARTVHSVRISSSTFSSNFPSGACVPPFLLCGVRLAMFSWRRAWALLGRNVAVNLLRTTRGRDDGGGASGWRHGFLSALTAAGGSLLPLCGAVHWRRLNGDGGGGVFAASIADEQAARCRAAAPRRAGSAGRRKTSRAGGLKLAAP